MARRRELLDIARGISSSFNGRNNDFQGYWALGFLYQFAITNNINSLVFNILNDADSCNVEYFSQITSRYHDLLYHLLKVKNMNYDWVKSASIKIDFNQSDKVNHDQIFYPVGDPYIITMKLIDDRGKIFESKLYGKCKYHGPNQEIRRAIS